MRRAACVVVTSLLAALAVAAPVAAAVPASFFGVMADGPLLSPGADLAGEARMMRSTGVGTVRVAFYWRQMQPQAGGPIDFGETDRIVAAISGNGMNTLPVLVRAPAWAASDDHREGAVPSPDAYGAWVAAVVQRYGVNGSFWSENPGAGSMKIRAFQVWNEPDIDKYLAPVDGRSWAEAYVPLLRAARTAIKTADPNATVVAAGLTNRSWEDLDMLYAAGARGLFDAAAIHPFSRRVSNVVKIARLARQTMRRRGDERKPLLLTEVSWSSGKGRSSFNYGWETTERGQADRVRQALEALARERTRLRIGGVWWYTWLSPKVGERESFHYSGLRRLGRDGRPVSKPALSAFRQTVRRLRSRRRSARPIPSPSAGTAAAR